MPPSSGRHADRRAERLPVRAHDGGQFIVRHVGLRGQVQTEPDRGEQCIDQEVAALGVAEEDEPGGLVGDEEELRPDPGQGAAVFDGQRAADVDEADAEPVVTVRPDVDLRRQLLAPRRRSAAPGRRGDGPRTRAGRPTHEYRPPAGRRTRGYGIELGTDGSTGEKPVRAIPSGSSTRFRSASSNGTPVARSVSAPASQ